MAAAAAAVPEPGSGVDQSRRLKLEVCVDTPQGLAVALANGADRIELCSALSVGGLTPSHGFMQAAAAAVAALNPTATITPVVAMIRPRNGDFMYTTADLDVMKRDIRAAKEAGLAGVVVGASCLDGSLDKQSLAALVGEAKGLSDQPAAPLQASRPFTVTLHRAIDLTSDPVAAVDVAVGLGVDRILTSGGAATAMEGAGVIQRMVERAAGRLCVMAGSGVSVANAAELVAATGVTELHASCSSTLSPVSVERVSLKARAFGFLGAEGGEQRGTDGTKVRDVAALLHGMGTAPRVLPS